MVLFQNMTALSPTRKYLSAIFTAVSSLSTWSQARALKQISAFLLGPVHLDQNLRKGYINCPSYIVIPDYLTDMSMLELTLFHFIVTQGKNTSPSKLTMVWIHHVGFFETKLNLMTT